MRMRPEQGAADETSPGPSFARRGDRKRRPPLERCLNCDAPIAGHYCAHCGQEARDQTVAAQHLAADLLSEFLSFDSKLLRTLAPLLFRPGLLTNAYNAGQRVRYLSPLKLYLTLSVVFFLVLPHARHVRVAVPPEATNKLQHAVYDPRPDTGASPGLHIPFGSEEFTRLPRTVGEYDAAQRDPQNRHPDPPAKRVFLRQLIKFVNDPSGYGNEMWGNLSKTAFVLLPAFALLLKLFYWKRLYIEHIIFALHTHAFAFAALTLIAVLHSGPVDAALAVSILLYAFVALKRVYRQGWCMTAFKFVLLAFHYALLLVLALLGTALVAFLLF